MRAISQILAPLGGDGRAVCILGCIALQSGRFRLLVWASLAYASGCLVIVQERLLAEADGGRPKLAQFDTGQLVLDVVELP